MEERQAEEEEEGDSGEGSEEDEDEDKEEEQDSDFDELDEENAGKKRGSSEKQVCDEAPCCTQPQVQVLACGMVGFIMSGVCVCFQAAAALCISVGSFSDPDELPGLAHFLEHSESCDENIIASVLAVIVSVGCWPTKRKHILLKLCCFLSVSCVQWCSWAARNTRQRTALMPS